MLNGSDASSALSTSDPDMTACIAVWAEQWAVAAILPSHNSGHCFSTRCWIAMVKEQLEVKAAIGRMVTAPSAKVSLLALDSFTSP